MGSHSHGETTPNVAAYFAESAYITNDVVEGLLALAATDEDKQKLKALGFTKNPYEETAGVLSFAERKVNLSSIERTFAAVEDDFLNQVRKTADAEKKKYLAKIEAIIASKDFAKLATVAPEFGGEIAKQYADTMKQLFETGKKTASDEMAVVSPETSKDVRGLYRAQALQMEGKIANEMAVTAQSESLYNVARGATVKYTMDLVEKAVENKLQKIITASGTQAMAGAFNTGRRTVFDRYSERIYGFQYTAVIDRRTTNLCLSLNGRVVAPNDPDFFRLSPPNHTGCRSFWVEILKDEFIKPAIEGIPDSIPRERTGLTNFQDLQKIIPYKPKSAATPDETRKQREGVLRQLVTDLRDKGVKFKPLPGEDTFSETAEAQAFAEDDYTGCVMLSLDPAYVPEVQIDQADLSFMEDGSGGREQYPHVTLLYGIDKNLPVDLVKEKISYSGEDVTVDRMDLFENEDADVLIFRMKPDGFLGESNASLKTLPNRNDHPDYIPHMTIAYLKK